MPDNPDLRADGRPSQWLQPRAATGGPRGSGGGGATANRARQIRRCHVAALSAAREGSRSAMGEDGADDDADAADY
eukprot:8138688-Pyramimonas_sp.AAC.1